MLQQHVEIFRQSAIKFNCIISLRYPNELADKWISRRNSSLMAKPLECKAKTADNPKKEEFAGLVVDPNICPDAFKKSSLDKAKERWNKFINSREFRDNDFSISKTGIVLLKGKMIHADYDLLSVTSLEHKNFDYQLFLKVIRYLNRKFGKEMIKHKPDFDPDFNDTGSFHGEKIYFFTPYHSGPIAGSTYIEKEFLDKKS